MLMLPVVRKSENVKEDIYEDLPLFEIEQRWGKTAAGKRPVYKD